MGAGLRGLARFLADRRPWLRHNRLGFGPVRFGHVRFGTVSVDHVRFGVDGLRVQGGHPGQLPHARRRLHPRGVGRRPQAGGLGPQRHPLGQDVAGEQDRQALAQRFQLVAQVVELQAPLGPHLGPDPFAHLALLRLLVLPARADLPFELEGVDDLLLAGARLRGLGVLAEADHGHQRTERHPEQGDQSEAEQPRVVGEEQRHAAEDRERRQQPADHLETTATPAAGAGGARRSHDPQATVAPLFETPPSQRVNSVIGGRGRWGSGRCAPTTTRPPPGRASRPTRERLPGCRRPRPRVGCAR